MSKTKLILTVLLIGGGAVLYAGAFLVIGWVLEVALNVDVNYTILLWIGIGLYTLLFGMRFISLVFITIWKRAVMKKLDEEIKQEINEARRK